MPQIGRAKAISLRAARHIGAGYASAMAGMDSDNLHNRNEQYSRDIADVPSVEVISTSLGLIVERHVASDHRDLDEARSLIEALAGLVVAASPRLGHHHAAPLRDGLRALQLAFREGSEIPDEPGEGPGEKYTGPVYAARRTPAQAD